MGMREEADAIRAAARRNNEFFGSSLPMIASENILSPRALEMLVTDFHGRYAEGLPGKRYYQGCAEFDVVESKGIELAKKLFRCNFANIQATSGTVSNMAVLKALVKPGDQITALSTAAGGHISHAKMGAVGVRGLNVTEYPWDIDRMALDIDGSVKLIKELKPKLCLFGGSVILFPTPLKGEVADACHEVGANVMFDGAHVLGLIAGGKFQQPLHEGADVMTGSTHKTLPGPQGGVVLSDRQGSTEADAKFLKSLDTGVFPGTNSSYHLHHVAAKAVAFAEHIEFGAAYASQIIQNAKALGEALAKEGFKVFGEDRGYTESHQCLVQVGQVGEGKGRQAAELLEKANIVTNMNLVPGDTKAMNPSGLRLGTQELTRVGMKEPQMREIASLYGQLLLKDATPEKVKAEVLTLRKQFNKVHFCFNDNNRNGYEFHQLA